MGLKTNLKLLKLELKSNPGEIINNALDKTETVLQKTGEIVSSVYNALHNPESEDRPHLSDKAYNRFEIYLGTSKAEEVKRDVESGRMDAKEAEEWSEKIELIYELSRGRRSIEPEEWRDFEEGWRPEGW